MPKPSGAQEYLVNNAYPIMFFVAGALVFYLYPNWFVISAFSILWFVYEYLKADKKNLKLAFAMGAFLAIFDFVIENLGAIYGFWVSMSSYQFVLAVPLEIILSAFFGGAAFSMFVSRLEWTKRLYVEGAVVFSIGGVVGELYLNVVKLMQYGNGWMSFPHAFLAYLATWAILLKFNSLVSKKLK